MSESKWHTPELKRELERAKKTHPEACIVCVWPDIYDEIPVVYVATNDKCEPGSMFPERYKGEI